MACWASVCTDLLLKRIKGLITPNQCNERAFPSCWGVGECVSLRGQCRHVTTARGELETLSEVMCSSFCTVMAAHVARLD